MEKFFIFILTLCLMQGLDITVAQTEDEINIQNVVEIVAQLAKQIEETVTELPQRLPKIIKNLEQSIRTIVEDTEIVEIFKNLKEEIENLVAKASSKASCSKHAFDKLDDLNEKTSNNIAECLNKSQKQAEAIKNKVEGLMTEANTLSVDVAKRMETCVKNYGENAAGLSECLQSEIKTIEELLKKFKGYISETVDVSEDLSKEISVELRKCLENVKQNAYSNSNKILSGVQNCMEEL